ncbi:hypothetical protein EMCRGX_G018773 [Ephydatia muelleri]
MTGVTTGAESKLFIISNLPAVSDLQARLKKQFGEGTELRKDSSDAKYALVSSNCLTEEDVRTRLRGDSWFNNNGNPPAVMSMCSQLVTIQYGAVSIRLACITQQLATKWGLEWGLEWNLNRASVHVTGSPEAFKDFRQELHQKMMDDASLLMRETATLSDVIRVLSDLPSLEDLSHHLHVNPPSDGLGTSKEAAILAVLKDWFSVYKHASQGRLVEVLSKMGIQEMAWGLLSPGVSESTGSSLDVGEVTRDKPLKTHTSPHELKLPNLSPDVLYLLEKLPDGDIEGVVYKPSEHTAIIQGPTPEAVDECVTKFQSAYQKTMSPAQLRVKTVTHSPVANSTAVSAEVANLNGAFELCVFVYSEKDRAIKLVSNSARQFDHAQKTLMELVEQLNRGKELTGAGWGGGRERGISLGNHTLHLQDGRVLTLKQSDLVREVVDVIVNAANDKLKHWGGVAGALNNATQGALQKISDAYVKAHGRVQCGAVAMTESGGGALKCKHVYHAVGPDQQCSPKECRKMIAKCVEDILSMAERQLVKSLALPAISSGVFGVEKELVAEVIIDTIINHQFTSRPPVLGDIRIVIIDSPTFDCFAERFVARMSEDSMLGVTSSYAESDSSIGGIATTHSEEERAVISWSSVASWKGAGGTAKGAGGGAKTGDGGGGGGGAKAGGGARNGGGGGRSQGRWWRRRGRRSQGRWWRRRGEEEEPRQVVEEEGEEEPRQVVEVAEVVVEEEKKVGKEEKEEVMVAGRNKHLSCVIELFKIASLK